MARIPTYVVSLPGDQDRLRNVVRQLDVRFFDMREAVGFPGRLLPDGACIRLTRDPNSIYNKGALGVMMSHLRIWERIALLDQSFALVLEDDVALHNPERLTRLSLPAGFAVVFCGDQTAEGDPAESLDAELYVQPAIMALPNVERRNAAVGAYGYLLSPAGAQRLLAMFEEHFYFGHVDIRMMAYCVSAAELERSGLSGRVVRELRTIRDYVMDGPRLAGYAMCPAIVSHPGLESRREREDALGLSRLPGSTADDFH